MFLWFRQDLICYLFRLLEVSLLQYAQVDTPKLLVVRVQPCRLTIKLNRDLGNTHEVPARPAEMPQELGYDDVFPLSQKRKGLVEFTGTLELVNLSDSLHPFLLLLLANVLRPIAFPALTQLV